MNTKIKSYLPIFSGFYNNPYWDNENEIDQEIEYFNEEYLDNIEYDDFNIDYEKYYKELSLEIFEVIKEKLLEFDLILNAEFEKLTSPKYYNYSNDSINCIYTINEKNLNTIKKYLKEYEDDFKIYIKERYTSCSGFSSHYSNDSNNWLDMLYMENLPNLEHEIGAIFDFILLIEEINEESIYYDVNDCKSVFINNYMEFDFENMEEDKRKTIKSYETNLM